MTKIYMRDLLFVVSFENRLDFSVWFEISELSANPNIK